jgi:hypothetical protein
MDSYEESSNAGFMTLLFYLIKDIYVYSYSEVLKLKALFKNIFFIIINKSYFYWNLGSNRASCQL